MSSTVSLSSSWLDQQFSISKRGSTVGQEFRAGTATFLTMSYILLVNPQLLSVLGIPPTGVVISTALSSFVGSFLCAMFGNLPLGLAPGIGLSAYLTYGLVLGDKLTLTEAFTSCFIAGAILLLISITGLSQGIMRLIPRSVKLATIVGMGLQIALVGMTSVKLVVPNAETIVGLGDVHSFEIWASVLGLVLIGSLLYHQIRGAILIGILLLTLLSWSMYDDWPQQLATLPQWAEVNPQLFLDFSPQQLRLAKCLPGIVAFLFIGVIDVSGVIFGMASLAKVVAADGSIPGATPTFIAVSVSTLVSAATGGTPVIVYVESATGIKEGGRTGLTALVISAYFLLSLLLSPVLSQIPLIATAPVAILVGAMMMSQAVEIDWNNMSEAIPAFLTLITMPFTFSITNGIVLGLITAFMFYITTGEIFIDLHTLCCGASSNSSGEGTTTAATELTGLTGLTGSSGGEAQFVGTKLARTESNSFVDDQPFKRNPSLILNKRDADAARSNSRDAAVGSSNNCSGSAVAAAVEQPGKASYV